MQAGRVAGVLDLFRILRLVPPGDCEELIVEPRSSDLLCKPDVSRRGCTGKLVQLAWVAKDRSDFVEGNRIPRVPDPTSAGEPPSARAHSEPRVEEVLGLALTTRQPFPREDIIDLEPPVIFRTVNPVRPPGSGTNPIGYSNTCAL